MKKLFVRILVLAHSMTLVVMKFQAFGCISFITDWYRAALQISEELKTAEFHTSKRQLRSSESLNEPETLHVPHSSAK